MALLTLSALSCSLAVCGGLLGGVLAWEEQRRPFTSQARAVKGALEVRRRVEFGRVRLQVQATVNGTTGSVSLLETINSSTSGLASCNSVNPHYTGNLTVSCYASVLTFVNADTCIPSCLPSRPIPIVLEEPSWPCLLPMIARFLLNLRRYSVASPPHGGAESRQLNGS